MHKKLPLVHMKPKILMLNYHIKISCTKLNASVATNTSTRLQYTKYYQVKDTYRI